MGNTGYIHWNQKEIPYEIIRSSRKTMALQVKPGGEVFLRIPYRVSLRFACQFAEENREWIISRYQEALEAKNPTPEYTAEQIWEGKKKAAVVIGDRAAFYSRSMGVSYGRITIRQQKTRWGSCSIRGNLNFNWKLALMPQDILDYVVVHELAHRREMNHSPAFWKIVEEVLPDYKERRKWLKEHGKEF